jgi:hypothetical protein
MTKECAFATQDAHTTPKFDQQLNIWQRISPLKVRVLQPILTQQVAKQILIKIKALIQVVSKSN